MSRSGIVFTVEVHEKATHLQSAYVATANLPAVFHTWSPAQIKHVRDTAETLNRWADSAERMSAQHHDYQRYLEIMYDHGCGEIALSFQHWQAYRVFTGVS